MPLFTNLFGSSRLQAILFLLRLVLLLLIIGAMPSCGKDSWIKETKPETEVTEKEGEAVVADSDSDADTEDERVIDQRKILVQSLRVFP